MAAQATDHEIVLSGHQAHSAAYGVATATQQAEQWESTLHGLRKEANKAWKDANDVIFSHLLKYDSELATFLDSTEDTLKPCGSNELFPPDRFVIGAGNFTLAAQSSLGPPLPHGNSHDVCLQSGAV